MYTALIRQSPSVHTGVDAQTIVKRALVFPQINSSTGVQPSNQPPAPHPKINILKSFGTDFPLPKIMSEASKPKYDSLPGIDTAPDVYETPELAEDVSTIQASTAVSESEEEESDNAASQVRHHRLQTDQARDRFQPSRVDADNVDFSDNISGQQRRSYRTSTRTQRRRGEMIGDDSDEEEESFERKLARVHQEALELEQEHARRMQSGDKTKTEERDSKEIMEFISDKVDSIYTQRRSGDKPTRNGAEFYFSSTIQKFNNYTSFTPSPRISKAIATQPPLPGSQVQRSQLDHVLSQAGDFDTRLTQLEQSLGLNGATMPDTSSAAPLPIFTTLERIEESVGLVTDASAGTLDAATSQIRRLIDEAEHLKDLRASNHTSSYHSSGHSSPSPSSPSSPLADNTKLDETTLTHAQETKINALYGTLPSLDKLTPLLPLVLDRLRTLRLVHTSAFQVDAVLTALETRQAQQAAEIESWRTKLGEVEEFVRDAEERTERKVQQVGGWVRDVEGRVKGLEE
ncbi:unnamed protein product [Periconia digitata]|uniref:Dynactin subunit 2 n=1 Tax=Periconia digitata TaxID=1303443 RepID=A0A9W4XSW6_9PLEO|nr:unnamed protein product [Periconia digitata]